MQYSCTRHPQNMVTHFCTQIECNNFMLFYCTQCDSKHCHKEYHIEAIEQLQQALQKLELPTIDTKQWEYCKQQMSKITANMKTLFDSIIQDYDTSIQGFIEMIQLRSNQQKQEIIQQLNASQEVVLEKYEQFQKLYQVNLKDYLTISQQVNEHIKQPLPQKDIEQYYQQMDVQQLYQEYQVLLQMQPELEGLMQENSAEIAKTQQLLAMLQDNQFEKYKMQVEQQIENALNIVWGKYYTFAHNINYTESRNSSVAESEILNRMVRKSRTSTMSIMSDIDNIISLAQQQDFSTNNSRLTLKLQNQSYGYSAQNLQIQSQLNLMTLNNEVNLESSEWMCTYCVLPLKNCSVVLTGGESNRIYLWKYHNDHKKWRVESSIVLCNEHIFVQCMELVYNPYHGNSQSQSSRQSFATLRVLLNPIVVVAGGPNIFIIQVDLLSNQLNISTRYVIKDQTDSNVNCLLQMQSMGCYNYFLAGMDRGGMFAFNYIISIDNTFSIRLDHVARHHKGTITSLEQLNETVIVAASNDRSVSFWTFGGNKLKPLPHKLTRFWEDITCIRTVCPNVFATFDTTFNIILWQMETDHSIKMINQTMNKNKMEVHEACVISNPENNQDFCLIVLGKSTDSKVKQKYRVFLYDRYLKSVYDNTQLNALQFESELTQHKQKRKQQYTTNHKIRIVQDQMQNKMFASQSDIRQSQTIRASSESGQQLAYQKRVQLVLAQGNNSGKHFIEYQLCIGE